MLGWLFLDSNSYGGRFGASALPLRRPTEPDEYTNARLHSLEAACAGLWELLKQKNGYTDEELIAVIKGVDSRNPRQPGTLGGVANVCPHCGHKMLTHNHTKCLWCGADVPASPF